MGGCDLQDKTKLPSSFYGPKKSTHLIGIITGKIQVRPYGICTTGSGGGGVMVVFSVYARRFNYLPQCSITTAKCYLGIHMFRYSCFDISIRGQMPSIIHRHQNCSFLQSYLTHMVLIALPRNGVLSNKRRKKIYYQTRCCRPYTKLDIVSLTIHSPCNEY